MLAAFDVETYKKGKKYYGPVLDATGEHVVSACIVLEDGREFAFRTAKECWNKIIELGREEAKHGRKLHIYGHNTRYDFLNVCDHKDTNISWFSESPFIVSYYDNVEREFSDEKEFDNWTKYAYLNNIRFERVDKLKVIQRKEIIKFLDSIAIYRMSLENLGNLIELPKLEMPEGKWERLTDNVLKKIDFYCINDCKVTLEAVKFLKDKLREDGLNIRNLCTINQIAISYIINELVKVDDKGDILYISKDGKTTEWTHKTKFREDIHQAYRASLTRAWKTGKFENVTSIDCNSLYPFSLTQIDLPDLKTERKVKNPLSIYQMETLLNKIGVSKVLLHNKSNDLGLIPIRTIEKSYVPLSGKYIIGTYTNMELKEAINEGYEILDIEWSILFEKGENKLKDIYQKIYEKRISSGKEFDKYFYKCIMNSSLGKFGQRRVNQELFIDSIEKADEYLTENIQILKGIDKTTDVMYKKEWDFKPKKYYAPIIPCLTTAYARIKMYREFKKVPLDKILYTDTDSIITIGDYTSKFDIGNNLGQFKVEEDAEDKTPLIGKRAIIWGTKSKSVGNNIAVAGAFKKNLKLEEFEKGIAFTKRLQGIKGNDNNVGKFFEEVRDLQAQRENFEEIKEKLDKEIMYIDYGIKDITYFMPIVNKILEEIN